MGESGIEATQVLKKRGSEVSWAIASIELASAVSSACAKLAAGESRHEKTIVSNRLALDFITAILLS